MKCSAGEFDESNLDWRSDLILLLECIRCVNIYKENNYQESDQFFVDGTPFNKYMKFISYDSQRM